jgi:hypothetical protein
MVATGPPLRGGTVRDSRPTLAVMADLDGLVAQRTVVVTTFRHDGSAVPTRSTWSSAMTTPTSAPGRPQGRRSAFDATRGC